ncbi:MAG: hypothetical protein ACI9EF_002487 [Pseudohongiellaceae bacterium]|jgi:hypothetical protein
MGNLHWTIDVAASPDEVYAYATDTAAGPDWTIGLLARELITPGPLRVGSIWRETRRVAGTSQTLDVEITAHSGPGPDSSPPYHIAGQSSKMGLQASFDVRITELSEGSCRVDLSGDVSATSFMAKPIAKKVRAKLEEQDDAPLRMLRDAVEARKAAGNESGAS